MEKDGLTLTEQASIKSVSCQCVTDKTPCSLEAATCIELEQIAHLLVADELYLRLGVLQHGATQHRADRGEARKQRGCRCVQTHSPRTTLSAANKLKTGGLLPGKRTLTLTKGSDATHIVPD